MPVTRAPDGSSRRRRKSSRAASLNLAGNANEHAALMSHESFLILFFKKEQKALLFAKRSKNSRIS
jgi:hypothetical protein